MDAAMTAAGANTRGLRRIFFGSNGLRAGWGVALYLVICVAVVAAFAFSVATARRLGWMPPPRHHDGGLRIGDALINELVLLAAAALATLTLARIERRRISAYGVVFKGAAGLFAQGLLIGFTMISALIGALLATHAISFGGITLHGADALINGLEWAVVFAAVALVEELLFRGYILQTLARGLNFRWAMAITSALFLVGHLPSGGENPAGLACTALIALVFAFSVWRTGSIAWALGVHAAWDWGETFFYGVPDSGHPATGALMAMQPVGPAWLSGGSAGPEGSALVILPCLVFLGVVFLTQRQRINPLDVRW